MGQIQQMFYYPPFIYPYPLQMHRRINMAQFGNSLYSPSQYSYIRSKVFYGYSRM